MSNFTERRNNVFEFEFEFQYVRQYMSIKNIAKSEHRRIKNNVSLFISG